MGVADEGEGDDDDDDADADEAEPADAAGAAGAAAAGEGEAASERALGGGDPEDDGDDGNDGDEDALLLEEGLRRLAPLRGPALPLAERVARSVWQFAMCYKLGTAEGVADASHVWYIEDEFGSAVRHAAAAALPPLPGGPAAGKVANLRHAPFVYMPPGAGVEGAIAFRRASARREARWQNRLHQPNTEYAPPPSRAAAAAPLLNHLSLFSSPAPFSPACCGRSAP